MFSPNLNEFLLTIDKLLIVPFASNMPMSICYRDIVLCIISVTTNL